MEAQHSTFTCQKSGLDLLSFIRPLALFASLRNFLSENKWNLASLIIWRKQQWIKEVAIETPESMKNLDQPDQHVSLCGQHWGDFPVISLRM